MKTPAQWMEHILMVERIDESADYGVVINVRDIAAIQRDAIAHEYGRFTEATLTEAGWYFWYPVEASIHNPQFIRIREDQVANRHLKFVPAGTYLGPVVPPKLL